MHTNRQVIITKVNTISSTLMINTYMSIVRFDSSFPEDALFKITIVDVHVLQQGYMFNSTPGEQNRSGVLYLTYCFIILFDIHPTTNIIYNLSESITQKLYKSRTYFICDNFDLIFGLTNYMSLQHIPFSDTFKISYIIPMVPWYLITMLFI